MSEKSKIEDNSAINFPVETNDGCVWKKGNIIFYQSKNNTHSEVNSDLLRYAYIVVSRRGEASLFLFDNHQHYVPIHFNGFKEVYTALSGKFGFNDKVFFEYLHSRETVKKEIWRRKRSVSYQVIKDGHFKDYAKGFEIQSPEKEFISWDATYGELAKNEHTFIEESPYGVKILKFKLPVRIGNVLIKKWCAYLDNERRDDAPMLHYYADCYDGANSDDSYRDLKRTLEHDIDEKENLFGYERDDQHYYSFEINGMQLSLVYTFDSEWQFNGGCTSFSIKNNREYADLLIDEDYENAIEVSDFINLSEQTYVVGNYKKNPQVKRRPAKLNLKVGDKPAVWLDKKNGKIGFADKTRSKVEDIDAVESIAIQNILPAKGPGGAYLLLNFNTGRRSDAIMGGKSRVFDAVKEKLEQLTKLKVEMEPEYHDC